MTSDKKLAVFVRDGRFLDDIRYTRLETGLRALGYSLYPVRCPSDIVPGTGMILSVGGDGTFLSAATVAGMDGIPVLGVNFGRLGFLSENSPEDICSALASGAATFLSLLLCLWLTARGEIGISEFAASLNAVILLKANFMRILNLGLFSLSCGLKGKYYYEVLNYPIQVGSQKGVPLKQGIDTENVASTESFIIQYNITRDTVDVASTKGFEDEEGNIIYILSELEEN